MQIQQCAVVDVCESSGSSRRSNPGSRLLDSLPLVRQWICQGSQESQRSGCGCRFRMAEVPALVSVLAIWHGKLGSKLQMRVGVAWHGVYD